MKTTKLIPSISLALTVATQIYAAPYYTNKAGDMIWDKETGLVWARCQLGQKWDGNTCMGEVSRYKFNDINNVLKEFNSKSKLGEHSDWIIPSILQLSTLRICSNGFEGVKNLEDGSGKIPYKCASDSIKPTIDSIAFPNTPASFVWSNSSSALYISTHAGGYMWGVDFRGGYPIPANIYMSAGVRLVRNGQLSDSEAALVFPIKLEQ